MREIKLASLQSDSIDLPDRNVIRKEGKHMILNNDTDLRDSVNTPVCDGKGGFRVRYAMGEYAEKVEEIKDCVTQHEEKHIEQINRTAPDICRGGQEMDGRVVRLTPDAVEEGRNISYEKEGWGVGISCLEERKKLEGEKDKPDLDLFTELATRERSWKNQYRNMFREVYDASK